MKSVSLSRDDSEAGLKYGRYTKPMEAYSISAPFAEAIEAIMETLCSTFDQIELFSLQWLLKCDGDQVS